MAVADDRGDITSPWIASERSQWQQFTRERRESMTVLPAVSEMTKPDSVLAPTATRRSSQ
jgi:hypothetical protein